MQGDSSKVTLIMKLHLIKFAAFYLVILNIQCFGQNNLNIIDSLLVNISNEIKESFEDKFENKNIILNVIGSENETNRYIKNKIGNIFSQNNNQVFRNFTADSSFEGTVFEVQNFQTIISYSEPYEKEILGTDFVDRHIFVVLEGQIYNYKDNKIISAIEKNKDFKDEIEYDQIKEVESSPYRFTQGEIVDITMWQKILEPALVVSSVVAVLLLLFTQRS